MRTSIEPCARRQTNQQICEHDDGWRLSDTREAKAKRINILVGKRLTCANVTVGERHGETGEGHHLRAIRNVEIVQTRLPELHWGQSA